MFSPQVMEDGSSVEIMQQQLREDIESMLPKLRAVDQELLAIQDRYVFLHSRTCSLGSYYGKHFSSESL